MITVLSACVLAVLVCGQENAPAVSAFRLAREEAIAPYGGIPYTQDLDSDGKVEIVWLQGPGLFHSNVFDTPPWKGRFTDAERNHFCLTATDAEGRILWQLGKPWSGDRPFVTHSAERAVDFGDIDSDGTLEVVAVNGEQVLVLDGRTGDVELSVQTPADNAQIVRVAHTGPGPGDWTLLVKNAESAYPPYEYANPAWFYDSSGRFLKTAEYLGAGHTPVVDDVDADGFDEFIIGFNLVDHDLSTVWSFLPVPRDEWNAPEMHVDDIVVGDLGGRKCVAYAASDTTYVLELKTGTLLWKRKSTHPQHCQIGEFDVDRPGGELFVHNKRAELQLMDPEGNELWRMMPPENFPVGAAEACIRQKFHVFDPTTQLPGEGPEGTDLLIFTDCGWPYAVSGAGQRCLEFPHTPNTKQDWGEVPGRPDDYGYGFYARWADFDGDGESEVLINDRRYAWFYEAEKVANASNPPASDGTVLHVDFENYVDGVVQALNAGIRWLGDPFSGRNEGIVEVTKTDAYSGNRCGHVATETLDQIGRIRLQPRFDAPRVNDDSVIEFVFRPVRDTPTTLDDFVVWSAGGGGGLTLLANGSADDGVYGIDVVHGASGGAGDPVRTENAISGLRQDAWVRFVLLRMPASRTVDLWIGEPGREDFVGTYPDRNPEAAFANAEIGDVSDKERVGAGFWDDIRVGNLLEASGTVAPPEPALRHVGTEVAAVPFPMEVDERKQLFLDDAVIESEDGLKRTLHPVNKHPGNPLVVADKPWEGVSVLLYGAVIPDPETGMYRMWYLAWGKHVGQSSYICYAESEDGLRWTKPNLGLHEFQGSRENNIVIPDVTSNTTVIFDPRDSDPSRRYKAVIRDRGTRAWLSPDGIHWRDHGVIIDQCYDSTSVHWDPWGEKWIASTKIFRDGKRARGYAESKDFFRWSDTYFMATVDELDAPDDQMYALTFFPYESLYVGLLRMYHVERDLVDIQLASSRNAKRWDRLLREPFVPCSPQKGTWDYGNNAPSTDPPLRVGDELWFYYSGRSTTHEEVPNRGAIGLGTLRLDGFVSMDAGNDEGWLVTKPCRLAGRTLYVNANAGKGSLVVEIRAEDGTPLEPFRAEKCMPVEEDGTRIAVRWKDAADLAVLGRRSVRLRFHLKEAGLYAFWTE